MTSPGVFVSVEDQSIYSEPNPTTIPLVIVATRANKPTPDGSATAQGTTESNKLRTVTSQRELLVNYGNPVFVKSDGEPVHGDETNEYQLLAAHSFLGRGSRAFIVRADVDTGQLVPTDIEPTLPPPDNTFWIPQIDVVGGVFLRVSGSFVPITDTNDFTVFTSDPTGSGVQGDWGFDYTTQDGTLVFNSDGVNWLPATDANLTAIFGGTVNLHVQATAPTGAGVEDGDYWWKTTSSAGGMNLNLRRFRAVDGVFVQQVILRQPTMPIPNEGVVWEDISSINTTGTRPLFIGTGLEFIPLPVIIQSDQPVSEPDPNTFWFDDEITDFALYQEGSNLGFGNQWVPINTTTVSNPTATQKVISASPPTFPSDGSIWVDVSTPENVDNYPVIKRFAGGIFTDITASVLIQSDDPTASLVLNGTYWMNIGESKTRNMVKLFNPDFQPVTVEDQSGIFVVVDEEGNNWEPQTGRFFGRKSQREVVVEALQAAVVANQDMRSEFIYYQLISVPGYPELYDEMIALNTDINEIAFVVADTPKFMIPSGIPEGREITAAEWITNANNVVRTGEEGFASGGSAFAAFWYPWCLATNIDGDEVFQPPSHMALRVIAFSDSVSAPWFPPAGYNRGRVDNATSVGFLTNDNEYEPLILTRAMRDILYENKINPIAFIPNRGLTVFGQKTNAAIASALDRINVSRLVAKMKYDLARLLEPFLFELNDAVTRRSAQVVTERYLSGLKSLRALFDYAVRCDESNNPASTIDANQLFVDVAIKPAKAIEFIFVPIQILGTGDSFAF
jgi:hypothetical protein